MPKRWFLYCPFFSRLTRWRRLLVFALCLVTFVAVPRARVQLHPPENFVRLCTWSPKACDQYGFVGWALGLWGPKKSGGSPSEKQVPCPLSSSQGVFLAPRFTKSHAWFDGILPLMAEGLSECSVSCRLGNHSHLSGDPVLSPPVLSSGRTAAGSAVLLLDLYRGPPLDAPLFLSSKVQDPPPIPAVSLARDKGLSSSSSSSSSSPPPSPPPPAPRSPEFSFPLPRAVFAMEVSANGFEVFTEENLESAALVVSFHRGGSDVWANYAYAWEDSFALHPDFVLSLSDLKRNTRRFAAIVTSKCANAPHRTEFLRELLSLLSPGPLSDLAFGTGRPPAFITNVHSERRLDSWGSCLHTQGLPPEEAAVHPLMPGMPNKVALLSQYKFALALENSIREDYVTEKVYEALRAGAVPVFWGTPNVAEFVPGGTGSFINAMDFESPRALADYLIHLDSAHEEYLAYHAWRTGGPGGGPLLTPEFMALRAFSMTQGGASGVLCRTCEAYMKTYCGGGG